MLSTRSAASKSLRVLALLTPATLIACAASTSPSPPVSPVVETASASAAPIASTAPPPPLPVAIPEVAPAPSTCGAFIVPAPAMSATIVVPACDTIPSTLHTLASAVTKPISDRSLALASLAACARAPAMVLEVVRASEAPMACGEAILTPALDAHGKEAMPAHLAAARAIVGASRLARLRPKKGDFDTLARAEIDAPSAEAALRSVISWRDAIDKQESESIGLATGAPSELLAIVRFESAAAWLALADEIRHTPLPDEIKKLSTPDHDLETRYLAKLDEVTMPLVDRAAKLALAGLGTAARDGILVRDLPSFHAIQPSFKSRLGFEARATRSLDLRVAASVTPKDAELADAATLARSLPPWALFAILERVDPSKLLAAHVVEALAESRGVPAALRVELERDKALDDAKKSALSLASLRVALSYGSRRHAEMVALWKSPKAPVDKLRVAIATALLGPTKPVESPPKSLDPVGPDALPVFDLAPLDAIAKGTGAFADAAAFDAALLSLELAHDASSSKAEAKRAYESAIARFDATVARKGVDKEIAAAAKRFAADARESFALIEAAK
ncbi:MAG: hypothetical protein ACHREM_07960 [Polyangiales bacterium]